VENQDEKLVNACSSKVGGTYQRGRGVRVKGGAATLWSFIGGNLKKGAIAKIKIRLGKIESRVQ